MKVSVVIPCYNQSTFLGDCLGSLLAQSFGEWEAIVVDDASSDPAVIGAVVTALADGRVRVVRHAINRGLAAARNSGFRDARHEWVLPLDADDELMPDFLTRATEAVREYPEFEAVFTDFIDFGARTGFRVNAMQTLGELLVKKRIPGAGALIRRSLWERVGGYCEADELRAGMEDWDFWISALERGAKILHIPEPLYRYRRHSDSMVPRMCLKDHRIRKFIYKKHKGTFDKFGMRRAFLANGYWSAADAHRTDRRPLTSLVLAAGACAQLPTRHNLVRLSRWVVRAGRSWLSGPMG